MPLPCEGGRPVCRAMSFCGCDEIVPAVVGASCGGGCCPWICPEWTIEEGACIDVCGVDGGRRDAGPRDGGTADAGPEDWRACTDQGQCALVANGCCDGCGAPMLSELDAVRVGREAAHFAEVCADPSPICPDCPTSDVPELVATCESGQCAGVDIRLAAITACTLDVDCRVRTTSCCECGGAARYITIAGSAEADYSALVCPAGSACPECAPSYPAELVPRCGADGHCTLTPP